ncbi:hypothetical protein ACI75Y_06900 [Capnocytophaga stomatis]|uniref:hypothetical protein n=1 Tax=Capnocytophaga stomatis TaxID=1848904 RepID=UPI00385AF1F1
MENKIVSTFMFSEPHEQDLLWLKFSIENEFVSEWIITESCYTFQGKKKELHLQEILEQERFKPFVHKIHYISLDKNFHFEYEPPFKEVLKRRVKRLLNKYLNRNYEFVTYSELASFYAEINQRQACVPYILQKYDKDDIVLLCDTDEIFDFNEGKIEIFRDTLRHNPLPFYIHRQIFCYDFDNYTYRRRFIPIVNVKYLDDEKVQVIKHPRKDKRNIVELDYSLVFEYTFCFSKEAIMRKLGTFAHVTELNEKDLDFAFENNISMISKNKIDHAYRQNKEHFYTKLKLDASNSPKFVRDNFDQICTNVVDKNYLENRKKNHIFLEL